MLTRRQYVAIVFLALGFITLFWSASDYFSLMRGDRMGASLCSVSAYWNCDRAALSPVGSFAMIPLGVFGAAWFFIVGCLIFSRFKWRDALLKLFFSLSFVAVAYLSYYLFATVNAGCIVCFISYACILIVAFLEWPRSNHPPTFAFSNRNVLIALVVGLAVIVTYAGFRRSSINSNFPEEEFMKWYGRVENINPEEGLVMGNPNGSITVVEFSDFGCPFCAIAAETTLPYLKTQPDVKIVFFPFPLDSSCNRKLDRAVHPHSCDWSSAAICASGQGKLWEFQERIFKIGQKMGELPPLSHAIDQFSLDSTLFEACMKKPETAQKLQKLIEVAIAANVTSTPTFYLQGRRFEGFMKMPIVRRTLEEARKK